MASTHETRRRRRKPRIIKGWAGYTDGRIHRFCGGLATYSNQRDASLDYDDVRRVEIREIGNGKR